MQRHHWSIILSHQRMWSWCQQIPSSLSTVKINQPSRLQRSGQRSQCQGSRSAVHQLPDHWSSMPSWHHFHQRGWTCVICQEDVKLFASSFRSSGDTFDFKQFMDSQAQRHWLILNDAEFKLWAQHHVLQVPRVKEPSGGHVLNWKIHESLQDAIYHMIYLTVAHCVRHGSQASSADLSTTYTIVSGVMLQGHLQHFEEEDLFGIKSLNLKSSAPGHLRLSSFMDQIQVFRAFTPLLGSSGSPSQFMASHVLYYESVSISDKYVSSSLSCIISHRTARLNERVYSLMVKHHPHLITVFFQNQPGQEKKFKHSVTEFMVKPSFFIEALISSPHLDGLDQQASASAMQISSPLKLQCSASIKPCGQVSGDQPQVISFTVSISICGAQQSRAHSHAQSLRFTTVQVLNRSSGIDQPQCDQSWFRELRAQRQSSSLSSSSLSSLSSEANQVRSLNSMPSQGSVSRSKDHYGLTWLKSKGSVSRVRAHSELRSLSHRHCIISQNRISGII